MLIAGGGTGGHLFPGIALADEFCTQQPGNRVLFVGTERGIEKVHVPRAGYELELIRVAGLKGMGFVRTVKSLLYLPAAVFKSMRIIKRFSPDLVIGVGGYASGPVLAGAWLLGLPTMVMEQNAYPGLTNRYLGKFAGRVFVAFEQAEKFFSRSKVRCLGNPVRKSLLAEVGSKNSGSFERKILVFGGSLGAQALNRVFPEAAIRLSSRYENLRIVHQTGESQRDDVQKEYRRLGLGERVQVISFIQDMASAYRDADLVVCRAGATTVAELTACCKPSVLVPYPHAADNHQELNAQALVEARAAVMIREADLTSTLMAEKIGAILDSPRTIQDMQHAAKKLARPQAAKDILASCLEYIGRVKRSKSEVTG